PLSGRVTPLWQGSPTTRREGWHICTMRSSAERRSFTGYRPRSQGRQGATHGTSQGRVSWSGQACLQGIDIEQYGASGRVARTGAPTTETAGFGEFAPDPRVEAGSMFTATEC